ncbi:MAG: hypothetical protein IJ200_13515 [Prevotella sp.]|nr:hypothetical protein [Prevotella sp.]
MKQKLLLTVLALLMAVGTQAQGLRGRIYYNGNMSVAHLLKDKEGETEEERLEREHVMDEIFTMSVTVEFPESHKMKCRMKIIMDQERAKELDVNWATRKLWQTELTVNAKLHNYSKRYWCDGNKVILEDDTVMMISDDGEQLTINDSKMEATLKRIK